MPRDFKKCKGVVAGWGVGGEPFAFPEEAGYPVGEEHGGSTYYMFEAHYDNPALHENVVDSSGMEVLLTPKLRKYDSALLTVGHDVSSLHLIPPGLDHFTTVAHCPDMCTQVQTVNSNNTHNIFCTIDEQVTGLIFFSFCRHFRQKESMCSLDFHIPITLAKRSE